MKNMDITKTKSGSPPKSLDWKIIICHYTYLLNPLPSREFDTIVLKLRESPQLLHSPNNPPNPNRFFPFLSLHIIHFSVPVRQLKLPFFLSKNHFHHLPHNQQTINRHQVPLPILKQTFQICRHHDQRRRTHFRW